MKKAEIYFLIFIFALTGFTACPALAHNPRIVSGEGTLNIQKPEISQAFYGQLKGVPHVFEINSDIDFSLYVNILVPKLPDINKDISVLIFKELKWQAGQPKLIGTLKGSNYEWKEFYEPFTGDSYWQGPEFKQEAEPAKYTIYVMSSCSLPYVQGLSLYQLDCKNTGKYSLAVGEDEKFPPSEILNTILLLPQIKKDFFNKSPWTAYFNRVGLFVLGPVFVLLGTIIVLFWAF